MLCLAFIAVSSNIKTQQKRICQLQGRRQKIFQGWGCNEKKIEKIVKKAEK